MTNEQFDALMNVIEAMIDAKCSEDSNKRRHLEWASASEQTARELLVTDSPLGATDQ